MTGFTFDLKPFFGKKVRGRKGTVGEFGEVTVQVERKKRSTRSGFEQFEVRFSGENMPRIVYSTIGPGRPTLRNARLSIDDEHVPLKFNHKALRSTSRALKITYLDRPYVYSVVGLVTTSTLRRPGVQITVTRAKNATGKGMSSFGVVSGEADALDLALAIILEEVDTTELTTSGAVSEALNRLLNPRSNEPIPYE